MDPIVRPDRTPKPGMSRRGLLRGVAATGIVAATTAAVTLGSATNALAAQGGWRWCYKCAQLWFAYSGDRKCPFASGTERVHSATSSGNYTVKFTSEGGGGQAGWRYCSQCSSLIFSSPESGGSVGVCPGTDGGRHIGLNTDYRVEVSWSNDGAGGQGGWKYCSACRCLWYSGHSWTKGVCAYRGTDGHTSLGSGDYKLRFGPAA